MKKAIYICLLIFTSISYAQSHRFTDLAILFSQDQTNGSARYTGLSGAMGAIGGDLSTLNINPAGLGVFNHHEFSVSLGTFNKNSNATYYGENTRNINITADLNQIGVAFVFKNPTQYWNKTVLGFNYQTNNNFNELININGNSGFASFQTHHNVTVDNIFKNGIQQDFTTENSGFSSIINIGLATQYKDNFYLGGAINFHYLDFTQEITLNEINSNTTGQILDALFSQYDNHLASGISLNFGFIYKVLPFLRIGASYNTPTYYYEIINESNIYDGRATKDIGRVEGNGGTDDFFIKGNLDIEPIINTNNHYEVINQTLSISEYNLRTPGKTNLSAALVLGKLGFISIDYSHHYYTSLYLGSDFADENKYLTNTLRNTHNLRAGGEIKLGNLSLRGGASYEQSIFNPNATEIDVLKLGSKYGASLGAGLRIENHKFDASYNYILQNNSYDFYDQYDKVNPANIELTQTNINLTYTYIF